MGKIRETEYHNTKGFLAYPDHYVNDSATIPQTLGVTEGTRKIVKAGTIFPANDGTAKGIVFNDYDVTNGDVPGAILIHGFVRTDKLPVAADEAAKTALKQVTFL